MAELLALRARAGVGPPSTAHSEALLTSDASENGTERITLTRQELDSLIDEALRNRSRR